MYFLFGIKNVLASAFASIHEIFLESCIKNIERLMGYPFLIIVHL